jgi:hypothetical protein
MSDPLAAIRQLYFSTSKHTIARDFDQAIDLLKSMANEEDRERAAVYMDGLAQMKSEWMPRKPAKRPMSERASGGPQSGVVPGRSDRSRAGGRRIR